MFMNILRTLQVQFKNLILEKCMNLSWTVHEIYVGAFKRDLMYRKANRKSQKLSPYENVKKNGWIQVP